MFQQTLVRYVTVRLTNCNAVINQDEFNPRDTSLGHIRAATLPVTLATVQLFVQVTDSVYTNNNRYIKDGMHQ